MNVQYTMANVTFLFQNWDRGLILTHYISLNKCAFQKKNHSFSEFSSPGCAHVSFN